MTRTAERTVERDMEKVIGKIRKILELSKNNPSFEEAQAAALKAQKLMAEYHISAADLENESTDPADITEKVVEVGNGNKWKFALSQVIARNFRCKVFFYGKSSAAFYGHEMDATIAADTYKFLFTTGNKAATNYYNKIRNNAKRNGEYFDGSGIKNSFLVGFVNGISESLEKQCTALMIVVPKEVEAGFEERTNGFRKITSRLNTASYYGREAEESGRRMAKEVLDNRKLTA